MVTAVLGKPTLDTTADLRLAILHGVTQWIASEEQPDYSSLPKSVAAVFQAQSSIGWSLWFKGFHVNEWSHLQNRYYDIKPNRSKYETGDIWNKKLIRRLLAAIYNDFLGAKHYTSILILTEIEKERQAQVTFWYGERHRLNNYDRLNISPSNLAEFLKAPSNMLHQWLKSKRNLQLIQQCPPGTTTPYTQASSVIHIHVDVERSSDSD